MEATVYRARHSGSVAVIDFRIVGTLEALAEALGDGWHPTEDAARAALAAAPVAAEPKPDEAVIGHAITKKLASKKK
jgi:hypothetical protein